MTNSFINKFKNRRIHVIGVSGIEGYSMARFWLDHGASDLVLHDYSGHEGVRDSFVKLHDYLPEADRLPAIDAILSAPVRQSLDKDYLQGIEAGDVICLSQNWFAYAANQPLTSKAQDPDYTIVTLLDHYFATFPGCVIGVTGSNGKSTTVDLITKMLEADGKNVFYGGNERIKSQGLLQIDQATTDDFLVLEISNRQLKLEPKGSPHIAVITNVTPNHLGEHGSMEAYAETKRSISRHQNTGDWLVLNSDDPVSGLFEAPFGLLRTSVQRALETGVCLVNGQIEIRTKDSEEQIVAANTLPIRGVHFLSNALCAVGAAYLAGTSAEAIRSALMDYHGLPGRLELVGQVAGTKYFYDIKSTVPQATVAALATFGPDEKIVLICGGESKGMSYDSLAHLIADRVTRLILLPGTVREDLLQSFKTAEADLEVRLVQNMDEAWQLVRFGEITPSVVLLSPAGAFFQSHFLTKGPSFKARVQELAIA